MAVLYNLLIHLYHLSIRFASLYNPKARQWIRGRKHVFRELSAGIDPSSEIAWFHAASLGEFEQGRPVIEAFKEKFPDYKILLSFFSPSGYEVRKNYKVADYIVYLPLDTGKNARRFISMVRPQHVFFIKYEYWYNYLSIIKKEGLPVYILSASFRPGQYFFKWYGAWFRKILKEITHIFVQNELSEGLLKNNGITNCSVSGDTRFDRVYEAAQQKRPFSLVEKFCGDSKILLMGSSWPEDEAMVYQLIKEGLPNLKIIIVPHEVDLEHIHIITNNLNIASGKYTELTDVNAGNIEVLIIDSIGILLHLYQYATVAYIGGGFGKGIHNILEAATFGKPVLFGPNYHKFHEAKELIQLEGAFAVHNYHEFRKNLIELLTKTDHYAKASLTCIDYVIKQRGATEKILDFIN